MIFQQHWWLEAAAPGAWGECVVTRGSEVAGRLTYGERARSGLRIVANPSFSPFMGPCIPGESGALDGTGAHEILKDLIAQLPSADITALTIDPQWHNILPFFWATFKPIWRCTYRIPGIADTAAVWSNISKTRRSDIKSAGLSLKVSEVTDIDLFCDVASKSFTRQGLGSPLRSDQFRRICTSALAHDSARLLIASDDSNRHHAAVMIVWDAECGYYLAGGADPALRSWGGQSLLLWHAIQFLSTRTKTFDFEGSSIPGVEHFCRSFGARQTPTVRVVKLSRRGKIAESARLAGEAILGKPIGWLY
jgi:hypothetical protein